MAHPYQEGERIVHQQTPDRIEYGTVKTPERGFFDQFKGKPIVWALWDKNGPEIPPRWVPVNKTMRASEYELIQNLRGVL